MDGILETIKEKIFSPIKEIGEKIIPGIKEVKEEILPKVKEFFEFKPERMWEEPKPWLKFPEPIEKLRETFFPNLYEMKKEYQEAGYSEKEAKEKAFADYMFFMMPIGGMEDISKRGLDTTKRILKKPIDKITRETVEELRDLLKMPGGKKETIEVITRELENIEKRIIKGIKEVKPEVPTIPPDISSTISKVKKDFPHIFEEKVSLDVQKEIADQARELIKNPEDKIVIDRSKRLFKRLAERLATGEIVPENIPEFLNRTGMTPEDFAKYYADTVSYSGKSLNILSKLAKEVYDILPKTPEIEAQFKRLPTFRQEPLSIWQKFNNLLLRVERFRKAMMVGQMATAVRNAISQAGRYSLMTIEDAAMGFLEGVSGKKPFLEAMYPAYEDMAAIFRRITPEGRKRLAKILDDLPLDTIRLYQTPMHDIVLTDKVSRFVTFFNRLQEYFFRNAVFDAKITTALKEQGINKAINLPADVIRKAVDDALKVTFAKTPTKGSLGGRMLDMWNNFWFLHTIHPFPRFYINALEFLYEFSPFGYTRFFSEAGLKLLGKSKGPLSKEAYRSLVTGTIGNMFLAGAFAIRNSDLAGERWYEVKITPNRVWDTRPFGPFVTYLFFAEALSHPERVKPMDAVEALFSINRLAGSGLAFVDWLRARNADTLLKNIENFADAYIAGFSTSFRTLSDLFGEFNKEERKSRWTRIGGDVPFGARFIEPIPFLREILPPAPRITRKEDFEREYPMLRQFTGLTIKTKNYLEREIDRLAIDYRDLMSRTGISELDRLVDDRVGDYIEEKMKTLPIDKDYQKLDDEGKIDYIRSAYTLARRLAREEVFRERQDLWQQYVIKRKLKGWEELERKSESQWEVIKPGMEIGPEIKWKVIK